MAPKTSEIPLPLWTNEDQLSEQKHIFREDIRGWSSRWTYKTGIINAIWYWLSQRSSLNLLSLLIANDSDYSILLV